MFNQIAHYARKMMVLGINRSAQVLASRIKNQFIERYWRRRALDGTAQYTWEYLTQHFRLNKFETFFESQRLRFLTFVSKIYVENIDKNRILEDAGFFAKNGIKIFDDLHCFTHIPWHTDVNLKAKNTEIKYSFDANFFYKDIKININTGQQLHKDIKVPWEISRFQHLFVLGQAYQLTRDKKYADVFVQQVDDWLDNNPYLLGVNWVCPMEVGLRAANWVIAFSFFKDADIDKQFWERFTCSLYDHLIYLENNWELYDSRTSNHYLSDLIGYLYLCWFFKDLDGMQGRLQWAYQEIIKEMDKQIFEEGSDYEGSTHYHQLVTELFYHAYLMFQECGLPISDNFVYKLFRMFDFIAWCTPEGGQLIAIGDNDFGKVLYYGLPKPTNFASKQLGTKFFSQFGLSIVKNKKWHISLRHHAYKLQQPSGHFHNDVGSITLAVDGIPVIIDPGSYVYTPSADWRNKFRSVQAHNTCYLDGTEPVKLTNEIFFLDLPEHRSNDYLCVEHNLYQRFGLSFVRRLHLNEFNNELVITDQWLSKQKNIYPQSSWNFTLGPDINPKKENNVWLLQYKNKTLATLYSDDLDFQLKDTWVSPVYSKKIKSTCLRAKKELQVNQPIHIYLSLSK